MAKHKATVIGSAHFFRNTPDDLTLRDTVRRASKAAVDVVKIAAYASERAELTRLLNLVRNGGGASICAMAMGPMGPESRVALPLAGSCLTYGYLDRPIAPGQPSAKEIQDLLLTHHEEYRLFNELRSAHGA